MFRKKIKNYQITGKIKSLAINNNKCIYTIKNDSQEVLATIQSAYSLLNRLVFKFELEDTLLHFKGTAYFKKDKLVEFEIEDFDIQSLIKNPEIITSDYNGYYNTNIGV